MTKGNETRDIAIRVLLAIEKGEAFSSQMINKAIGESKQSIDDRDQRFLRELVYGVLENKLYLSYLINQVANRKIEKLKRPVRQILLLASYELFFLSTADHAAVNEYVNLCKKYDFHAKGFVNAVIRNLLRQKDEITKLDNLSPREQISVRYSHPHWMLALMSSYFDENTAYEIAKKNNLPPPLSLFVNPSKISREDAVVSLRDQGIINPRLSDINNHAILCDGGPVTKSDLFKNGLITIQSQPSIKTAEVAIEGVNEGAKILDLCAAPGSKTIAMATLSPTSSLVANDLSPYKTDRIKENISRFGLSNIETSVQDAGAFNQEWVDAFDVVLVDAPCSGLGLLRKKPDIRWNRREEDLPSLACLQEKIVDNAMSYVKAGGRLVYSTCTYGELENENIAERINQRTDFQQEEIDGEEAIHFHPLLEDSDGFFISRFKKI